MSCFRRTILFLIGVSFQFSFLFAQTDNSTPSETLTWNLEDYENAAVGAMRYVLIETLPFGTFPRTVGPRLKRQLLGSADLKFNP